MRNQKGVKRSRDIQLPSTEALDLAWLPSAGGSIADPVSCVLGGYGNDRVDRYRRASPLMANDQARFERLIQIFAAGASFFWTTNNEPERAVCAFSPGWSAAESWVSRIYEGESRLQPAAQAVPAGTRGMKAAYPGLRRQSREACPGLN
jgi:hypothetical protein